MVVNKTHFTRPLNHSLQGGKRGTWGFSTGVTKEVSPAVIPEAPWVPGKEDLSTSVAGEEDGSTLILGAGCPEDREGDWSTVKGDGGSSTGMLGFSGGPAGASEETEDDLSSVPGARGCPGGGGGG